MILVIGATGTVGRALVRRLATAGTSFRALVRSAAKGEQLGCPYVVADLDDAASLPAAFAGITRVFLNSSPGPAMAAQQRAAIDAAVAAGVTHLVKLSTRGADASSKVITARIHGELEAYLAATASAAGVAWTVLQPGFFMQNFFRHADNIRGQGQFFGAFGDGKIAFLDVADIAATAAVVLEGGVHAGETLVLTGPELMTHAEVAAALSQRLGRDIRYVDLPAEKIVGFMISSGTPPEMAKGLGAMMTAMAAGQAAYKTDTVAEVTGAPARHFARFLEENLDVFGARAA